MNLWQLDIQQKARIVCFSEEISSEQKTRLSDLGFAVGEDVVCLRKLPWSGPKIYQVQHTVYGLEKEVAIHIQLETAHE